MGHEEYLFHILGLGVDSGMITMVGISLLLIIVSLVATRQMQLIPGGIQNVMEMIVEMLHNFINEVMEGHGKKYFPFIATLFIFILLCNLSGLLPFAGELPGLAAPTASISVTVALALMVFASMFIFGIRENGLKFFKKYFFPMAFMFPFMILDDLVKPVSLSLRLMGNVYGDERVVAQIFNMVPILVPLVMQLFAVFICFIQALVFMLLTSVYISEATKLEVD